MTTQKNSKYETRVRGPSQVFLDSLDGGGSHYMVCGNCGRTHYCPDSDNFYHNEDDKNDEEDAYKYYLQDAIDAQKKDPDGVIIHYGVDVVMAKDLRGIAFVIECPCNGLTKYEDFLWDNRISITNYLFARSAQEDQWAKEQLSVNKLKGTL